MIFHSGLSKTGRPLKRFDFAWQKSLACLRREKTLWRRQLVFFLQAILKFFFNDFGYQLIGFGNKILGFLGSIIVFLSLAFSAFAATCSVSLNETGQNGVYLVGDYVDVVAYSFNPAPSPLQGNIYFSFPGSSAGGGWTNDVLCNTWRCAAGRYYNTSGKFQVAVAIKRADGTFEECGRSPFFDVGQKSYFNFSWSAPLGGSSKKDVYPPSGVIVGANLRVINITATGNCTNKGSFKSNPLDDSGNVNQILPYPPYDCLSYDYPYYLLCIGGKRLKFSGALSLGFTLTSSSDCALSAQTNDNSYIIYRQASVTIPQPDPLPNPVSISANGYSKSEPEQTGLVGAKIVIKKYGNLNCTGAAIDCGEAWSNSLGYWSNSCTNLPNTCIVYQEQTNPGGYIDGTRNPSVPSRCYVLNVNTVYCLVYGNSTFEGITFYNRLPATPTPTPTNTPTPTFTPTPTPVRPWFQTQEGSVVGKSVVSIIPSFCTNSCSPACFKFLSLQGDGGTSGVVGVNYSFYDLALGAGDVSQEGWLAENPFPQGIEGATYDYISNRLAYEHLFTERKDFDCDIDGCPLPTQTGVYQKDSSGTPIYLKGGKITNGNKVVIFINGDAGVKLTGNITVDNQSFLALMVKGDLFVDSTVTQAQGIFFSDNSITLLTSGGTDSQFIGEGSFVGKEGILIGRNLGGDNNKCKPAALFKERPDFAINLPADFAYNRSVFQEVAP